MQCRFCGAKIPDDVTVCPKCGSKLKSSGKKGSDSGKEGAGSDGEGSGAESGRKRSRRKKDGPTKFEAYSQAYDANDPNLGRKPKRKKVYPDGVVAEYQTLGGWMLAVFVMWVVLACSLAFSYLKMVQYTSAYMQTGLGAFAIIYDVGMGVVIVTFAASIFMMWLRKQRFLFMFQISQIAEVVVSVVLMVVLNASVSGALGLTDIMGTAGSIVFSILFMIACTAYACASFRVQSYMRSTDYIDKALFRILT